MKKIILSAIFLLTAIFLFVSGYFAVTGHKNKDRDAILPSACAKEGCSEVRTPDSKSLETGNYGGEPDEPIKKEAEKLCASLEALPQGPSTVQAPAAGINESARVGPVAYFNYDADSDKEILGACETDLNGGFAVLYVLDLHDGVYKPAVLKDKRAEIKRQKIIFGDVVSIDMNGDGMDEISYGSSEWSGSGGQSQQYLYVPSRQLWFWRSRKWETGGSGANKTTNVGYSANFDLDTDKKIKAYLDKLGGE